MSHDSAKSNQTRRWQEMDARHHLHPFTTHADLAGKGARVITSARGVYIYDSEGNRLIDGMAGLWCVQVGYGREELAEAGYKAMKELSFYNSFFQTTNPYIAELSARLATLCPNGIDRFFFANSGSEGNDSAIKLIRYYWNLKKKPQKKIFIARKRAYHGVTIASASLSGLTSMHPQADLPLPGFVHIDTPYWFGEGGDLSLEEFGLQRARALETKILELGPENVAAFVAEPVTGAGGLIIAPDGYWAEINRICEKYDILLHIDEVICGFGRTGEWFGSQTLGIKPDSINMAKGLSSGYQPIAALGLGPRIGEVIFNSDQEMSHGFTYSGHPVAAAVALANLDLMQKENLVTKARSQTGASFRKRLAELADHPLVGETRSIGMLGAIELVPDKRSRKRFDGAMEVGTRCRNHCFANGLVMRAIGDTMVLSPPLVISEAELDELFALARRCLDLTAHEIESLKG